MSPITTVCAVAGGWCVRKGSSRGLPRAVFFQALDRIGHELTPGSTVALVFCDRGDRYLDTVYSDAWITAHFGTQPLPGGRRSWNDP